MSRSFIFTYVMLFIPWVAPAPLWIHLLLPGTNKRNRNGAEAVQGVLNWIDAGWLSFQHGADIQSQPDNAGLLPVSPMNQWIIIFFHLRKLNFTSCLPSSTERSEHRVSVWTRTDKDRSQDRCSRLEDDRWCLLHSSQDLDTTTPSNYVGDTTENLSVRIICKLAVDPSLRHIHNLLMYQFKVINWLSNPKIKIEPLRLKKLLISVQNGRAQLIINFWGCFGCRTWIHIFFCHDPLHVGNKRSWYILQFNNNLYRLKWH